MHAVDDTEIFGELILELFDEFGNLKDRRECKNLITTVGDQYLAQKAIVGISPASPSAPTAINGMKLGTGTTAAAKSGAGGALVTYLSGSNAPFDASFPAAAAVAGTDTGWTANFQTSWAAGVATGALTEAVIVNDQATNATSTAANTYSRTVFSVINKGASDTLVGTWKWKFLGA